MFGERLALLWVCLGAVGCSDASARLWLGGDVHLGGVHTTGANEPLSALKRSMAGRIAFVNLEGPVRATRPTGPGLRLHNHASKLQHLRDTGVRVVSVANNHAWDAGAEGLEQTVAAIQTAGLLPVGGSTASGSPGFVLTKANKMQVAWTAHDLVFSAPGSIVADIRAARRQTDFVVASLHSTGPPSYIPAPQVEVAVDAALAAGAAIVAVHGSHALAKVERRGDRVVAWGLGNVAFACDCTAEADGVALLIDARQGGQPEVALIPIEAGLGGKTAALHPDAAGVLDLLVGLGTSLKGRKQGVGSL